MASIAFLAFIAFWVLAVAALVIGARWWPPLRDFRHRMLAAWKGALLIAALCLVSGLLGNGLNSWATFTLIALAIFCQALIGLALAHSIAGFEPLPVAQSIVRRERTAWRQLAQLVLLALLAVVPLMLANMTGTVIGVSAFRETMQTQRGDFARSFSPNLWQVFFSFLAGAGIAEETPYRLVAVTLVWRLTRRPWLGVLFGALLFGAYHLSPINSFYLTYWQTPITTLFSVALTGIVLGYLYVKLGYEAAVLAHTFVDWIPMALFLLLPQS